MLTVRGQQHSFMTHERVFLWKCQSFETENVSTWWGLEPPTFGFMPNALTYWASRARHLLSHVFEHWLWRYRYFLVNIWNVICAQATAFIFDTRTGVLVKVSTFLRQKIPRPEGGSNSQLWDSCRWLCIVQIGPLSFQAAIEHKPRQVRWGGLHAPVVTEWWPACLHKQFPVSITEATKENLKWKTFTT